MSAQKQILIVHGPNLNLLGEREVEIYGTQTLAELNQALTQTAKELGVNVSFVQSNHEGALIDAVQEARQTTHGLIINPAGYSHTSVALRDAMAAYPHPSVEVHLSNIYQREGFRHHSYMSGVVSGVICGLGTTGYHMALRYLAESIIRTGR